MRAHRFTQSEIMDAARAAARTGLTSRLTEDGCILIGGADMPTNKQYETVPFPARQDSQSYVYFLQTGCYIKIGVAVDIRRRHSDIQGNNPLPVRLVHYVPGNASDERAMHRRFDRLRHDREWFLLASELVEFLDEEVGR